MRFKIDENDRISTMLYSDRFSDPEIITPVLRTEIEQLVKNYVYLSGDVKVRYRQTDEGLLFMIEIPAESVKKCGYC